MSTTPTYRYYTADLLTGNVVGDLYLYGVTANMQINGAGDLNASFPLGRKTDSYMLSATLPGRTALYVERNDELIWGGIIWVRDYDSNTRQGYVSAQTFDSFYQRTVLEKNYVKQAVEQVTCFTSLVSKVNAQDGGNIGITCPAITATGIVRTILLPAYEFHYAQEVVDQLIVADDGLEYTVELADSATVDHPTKTIRLGKVDLLNVTDVISLDFPGSILKYNWTENAFQGGNKIGGRGGGDGNQAPTAIAIDQSSRNAGYPSLWAAYQYPDVIDAKLVKAKTKRKLFTNKVPVTRPPIVVKGDAMVGHWQKLGATIQFHIEDLRFPTGLTTTRRLYGWDMTFGSEDTQETVTLTTDNGDTA